MMHIAHNLKRCHQVINTTLANKMGFQAVKPVKFSKVRAPGGETGVKIIVNDENRFN